MEIAKLKNGREEILSLVTVTMMTLYKLMEENPIALYELTEKCKNPEHIIFGQIEPILQDLALINNGQIHDSIKNIILSAIKGEGLELTLINPISQKGYIPTQEEVNTARKTNNFYRKSKQKEINA